MKKRNRSLNRLMLADGLILIAETIVLLGCAFTQGAQMLRYYTQLSNLLAAIACAVSLLSAALCRRQIGWVRGFRQIACCCTTLTMLVSAFVLPAMDADVGVFAFMFTGKYLFLHTLCPLGMLISQLTLQRGRPLGFNWAQLAVAPTVIYGAISMAMNADGVYSGPYPFLRVDDYPSRMIVIFAICLLAGNFLLALGVDALSSLKTNQTETRRDK